MQEKNREKSILKRKILIFLKEIGLTREAFYQATGIANGILSQSTGMNENSIMRFINSYPEVSTEWLFRDVGPMILEEDQNLNNEDLDKKFRILFRKIEQHEIQIQKLKKQLFPLNVPNDEKDSCDSD